MKIVKSVYDKLLVNKLKLEQDMKDIMDMRESARKDNDLSENADYKKACDDLEHKTMELNRVMRSLDNGYPVPVSTSFNLIDVGSKFNLKVKLLTGADDADVVGSVATSRGSFRIEPAVGSTYVSSVVTIAGDINEYLLEGFLSSECLVARTLIGKPLGKYRCRTPDGEDLEIEASSI